MERVWAAGDGQEWGRFPRWQGRGSPRMHDAHVAPPPQPCCEGVNAGARSHPGPAPFLCSSLAPPGFSSFPDIVLGPGYRRGAGARLGCRVFGCWEAHPPHCPGDMGTLPRTVPLGARARTRWQVRESGGPASATAGHRGAAPRLAHLCFPLPQPSCPHTAWGSCGPHGALAVERPALVSHRAAWALSQPWIPRLVFSSVSFFPQCVIAACSPPQLSPALAKPAGGGPLPDGTPGLVGEREMLWGAGPRAPPGAPGCAAVGVPKREHSLVRLSQPAREGLSRTWLGPGGREGRGEQQTVNLVTPERSGL